MLNKAILLLLIISLRAIISVQSQDLPACSQREFLAEFPRVSPLYYCIELPVLADSPADRTYTSLVFDDEGILYATHPYRGQIVALTDTDGDFLPDSETIIADNLRYPNGITHYNDLLYVLGDGIIYTITDGIVETLVDDLPGGRGFIARAILIHEDMLYIAIPSPCDYCEPDDPLHGTVIRMQMDGSEPEVIAEGLRYPAALAIYQDALLVTDSVRDAYDIDTVYDEINRIDLNSEEIPHFGFPYCIGYDNIPDYEADFDCDSAISPIISLRTGSNPIALTAYEDETFPQLIGHMMVVSSGSSNSSHISGHALFSFNITDDGFLIEMIAPVDDSTTPLPSRWQAEDGRDLLLNQAGFVNNQAGGIFPHFPYDIAVSPEGWLYFSVNGKGIYVLRPRT